ncbi:hypothetical protein P872_08740 [Rhodonellum psychrophilum GCM71 = DSM 17998]|uniref:Uncharacterized protein n=2 Tax=Rhodonellum TaxID=336827 RepID=U5BND5_9BACT|nr:MULTISPECIES: hypothetical protein [Rhodonellum]ERM82055.1 hypothetical protein P872_08740 [Rhodonellum psychrophilum GCM71 = DSM 17998]SDZ07715.1 hypothetical protein SAMN05444412_105189 [Rhodonellum ikkaensis]
MKKLEVLLLLIFISIQVHAQDVLTKKNGEDIIVKVLEIGQTEIKYKMFNNTEGPTFSILKSDVVMVQYENGTRSIFANENQSSHSEVKSGDLYVNGQRDASIYYKGYKPAGTGTLFTTLLFSPLVGLIPALITSSTEPKEANLGFPNSELMDQSEYYRGYTQKSKKIKSGKVWKNWGIGFGITVITVVALTQADIVYFY